MEPAPLRPVAELVRRTIESAWRSRGGGFYGLVAALTFLYVQSIGTLQWLAHPELPQLGVGWLIGRFVTAVPLNIGLSMIWPVTWLGRFGLFRALVLAAVALFIYRLLRPSIVALAETPIVVGPSAASTAQPTAAASTVAEDRPSARTP